MNNIFTVENFLVILEEGSFSAAGKRLYVSWQSLSEQMKKLEDNVGAQLFNRTRPLTLTPAGVQFAGYAKDMVDILCQLRSEIKAINYKPCKQIILGVPTFGTPFYLDMLLKEFMFRHPECNIVVKKRHISDIEHNMEGLDFYFGFLPVRSQLNQKCLAVDTFGVLVSEKLLRRVYGKDAEKMKEQMLQTGDLRLLRELPYIMPLDRWGRNASHIEQIFGDAGFAPNIGFQSDIEELNMRMCLEGQSAIIVSVREGLMLSKGGGDGIAVYKIRKPPAESRIILYYDKHKSLDDIDNDFLRIAEGIFRKGGGA
jgi:DNA-binding transcriptional LysR family regulator